MDELLAALPRDGEVVAVDDGSTDETAVILEDYASRDARLLVVRAEHRGVSAARNTALDRCRGEFVFFVDPDDGVEPDFFDLMLVAMRRDGADYCLCAYRTRTDGHDVAPGEVGRLKGDYRFGTNEEIVSEYLPRIFGYSLDDVRAWYRGVALFGHREMAQVWRAAFRRDLIERNKIRFDETIELNEDMVFNAEYLLAARSMTCVPEPIYRVTARDTGATRTIQRDGLRFARNKLRMLAARNRLDAAQGGRLARLYAGTCVLSALELLSMVVRRMVPVGDGLKILREYLADATVRSALRDFPLSWRRPDVAVAVAVLRAIPCGG